ncbi:MAG: Mur ligase family protein, partial [Arenimonas sp.]
AVRHADVAIVTNVSADHFGEYGVHSLSDLADAKLVVARVLSDDGVLVLNADDPVLLAKAEALDVALAWFSLDHDHPRLQQHRRLGGRTCGVRGGELVLHVDGGTNSLGHVVDMPLTCSGLARYNIANIAGAALVASVLGVSPECIAETVGRFGAARTDNPGRLQRWNIQGVEILLDYAHNPDGLTGLLAIGGQLRGRHCGRLGLLLGQAGNRDDDALRELAGVAASARPDFIVLKDLDSYLRGREAGEVPQVLRAELLRLGQSPTSIRTVLAEVEAAQALFAQASPGDVLVLPVHNLAAREQIVAWLDSLGQ